MSQSTVIPPSECPRCQLKTNEGDEVFRHRKGTFKFDVDLAIQIASDGREPVEVDEESLRHTLLKSVVHEEHLPHVRLGRPGIIAHVQYPLENGQTVTAHLLIDGNHRAARSLKEGLPFFVYLLNEEETARIVMRAPKKVSLREPQKKPKNSLAKR
jgi:hypothetical protein